MIGLRVAQKESPCERSCLPRISRQRSNGRPERIEPRVRSEYAFDHDAPDSARGASGVTVQKVEADAEMNSLIHVSFANGSASADMRLETQFVRRAERNARILVASPPVMSLSPSAWSISSDASKWFPLSRGSTTQK